MHASYYERERDKRKTVDLYQHQEQKNYNNDITPHTLWKLFVFLSKGTVQANNSCGRYRTMVVCKYIIPVVNSLHFY